MMDASAASKVSHESSGVDDSLHGLQTPVARPLQEQAALEADEISSGVATPVLPRPAPEWQHDWQRPACGVAGLALGRRAPGCRIHVGGCAPSHIQQAGRS